LDKTILFAASGGQMTDEGSIGTIPVEYAWWSRDKIFYRLKREPDFSEGDIIMVRIDEFTRRRVMALHSAAHLVAFFILHEIGCGFNRLIGSDVTDHKARLDYQWESSLKPHLHDIEEKVNDFIAGEYPIFHWEEKNNPGRYRWWCEGMACDCSGLHPNSTAQIGSISLKRKTLGKNQERVEIRIANQE
jgi:alanyl-tRNA synthetase